MVALSGLSVTKVLVQIVMVEAMRKFSVGGFRWVLTYV